MIQTYALLLDAYRELNAKKLFWITLILSALIMLCIAAIGISTEGFSVFGWTPEILQDESLQYATDEQLNEARSILYKEVFNLVGITIWLTWAAIILAIFSTAGLFPDLMTSGAIDTLLTKPISRLRLFLTKYFLGLGFVAMQVAVFAICAFFVIGIRASDWDPNIFLAIPVVLLFFSYLYAICVLVGVWTRSTLLAVIMTIVAWLGMFVINIVDKEILESQAAAVLDAEIAEARADYLLTLPSQPQPDPEDSAAEPADPGPIDPAGLDEPGTSEQTPAKPVNELIFKTANLDTREGYREMWGDEQSLRDQATMFRETAADIGEYRDYAYWIKTPLPKTGETRQLMERLLRDEDFIDEFRFDPANEPEDFYDPFFGERNLLVDDKMLELSREQRPWWWIVFTSILFEVFVLGLAAWRFCRRDY